MAQYYKFNKDSASRKPGITPLKEAIDQMFSKYKLETNYNESYLAAHWERLMGKGIASRTTQVYVKNRALFLQVESAPLRNELARAKQKIIELINREVAENLIEEVVFI